jgi:hypothetical protein
MTIRGIAAQSTLTRFREARACRQEHVQTTSIQRTELASGATGLGGA